MGVDPGITGALALYDPNTNKIDALIDTPTVEQNDKKIVDGFSLANWMGLFAKNIKFVVFEKVHSMPNMSSQSTFTFGKTTGMVIGIIESYGIPIHYVDPSVWKSGYGLSKDKNKSRHLAMQLFPDKKSSLEKAKDHGRAEAVLLANYGMRFW